MAKKITILLVLLLTAGPALAFSPGPHEVCSPNGRYCATLNPMGGYITTYRAGDKQDVLWTGDGFSRVAALADDGQHLVLGHGIILLGGRPPMRNFVPRDYDKHPFLVFYRRGHIFRRIRISDIMTDAEIRTERVGDYYRWGDYLGLDEDGYFVVRSATGREIRLDMTTGRVVH